MEQKTDKSEGIHKLHTSLLGDVFLHLPLADIKQCRLVSKEWYSPFQYQKFVEQVKIKHGLEASLCLHDQSDPGGDVLSITFNEDANHSLDTVVRETAKIPVGYRRMYGFGYDKAEKDYIIVEIVQGIPPEGITEETSAAIFSLKREEWNRGRLREFSVPLSKYAGNVNENIYLFDYNCCNLVEFSLSLDQHAIMPLPLKLMGQELECGVAREKEMEDMNEVVKEVLLISYYNFDEGMSTCWRFRKRQEGFFEEIGGLGNEKVIRPLSYLLGNPTSILLLIGNRTIVVHDVVEQSRREIYSPEEEERRNLEAIAFYETSTSTSLKQKVTTIQIAETKLRKRKKYEGSLKPRDTSPHHSLKILKNH